MNHASFLHTLTFTHFLITLFPKVVMLSILSMCMCVCVCMGVSLIMYQHSDGLTQILLSSFSLYASFFLPISSSHRASFLLSLYLVLRHDVMMISLCSIPFLFPSTALYLTGSHFLGWIDMYLSVSLPICFAISLACVCASHMPQLQLIPINKLLSFTVTSEQTALQTLVKPVSMDMKLGRRRSGIMSPDLFGGVFHLNKFE